MRLGSTPRFQNTKDKSAGKLAPKWKGPYKVILIHWQKAYNLEDAKGRQLKITWDASFLRKYYH